jgi:hypothetical protein
MDEDGGFEVSRFRRWALGAVVTDGVARYPRIVPKNDDAGRELKKRTLTNLYNARPAWLDLAHRRLDAAVFAAYGWSDV